MQRRKNTVRMKRVRPDPARVMGERETGLLRFARGETGNDNSRPQRDRMSFMPEKSLTPDEKLQQEFNRWAAAGEGPKMENHNLALTPKPIAKRDLARETGGQ